MSALRCRAWHCISTWLPHAPSKAATFFTIRTHEHAGREWARWQNQHHSQAHGCLLSHAVLICCRCSLLCCSAYLLRLQLLLQPVLQVLQLQLADLQQLQS
jgi:hypothetical protein